MRKKKPASAFRRRMDISGYILAAFAGLGLAALLRHIILDHLQ